MKNIFYVLVVLIIFSCKKGISDTEKIKTKDSNETEIEIVEDKLNFLDGKFRIVFEGIFPEDDLFLIFYSDAEGKKLSNELSLRKDIVGSEKSQKLIFEFPENVHPFSIRIDFSDKKSQKHVRFQKLQFIDKFNRVVINNSNLEDFFTFNKYMQFDKEDRLLQGIIFKLNNKDAYNPYFISNHKFSQVLKDFHQASKNKTNKNLINDLANIDLEDGRYRVIIDGFFEKDDMVLLYYNEDTAQKFDLQNSLRLQIKGSDSHQIIIFTLPKGRYASKIQLDISDKKTQSKVEIRKIMFFEGKGSFTISKQELSEYFYPNNYIELNNLTGDFYCKTITENSLEKYNPYFVSTPKMIEALLNF